MAFGLHAKSEGVRLIVYVKTSKISNHQRHRQTDRQTTCNRNTALCTKVHRAVKIMSVEVEFQKVTEGWTMGHRLTAGEINTVVRQYKNLTITAIMPIM